MIIIKYFCLFNVSWLLLATYPFYTDATPQKNARSRPTLYQIKPNDTLWHIAAQYLPTALDWPTLYHANAYIVDPNLIYPQKPLVIPAADKFEARASTGFIDLAYGVGFNARPRTNTPPNTPGWGSDSYRADSVANTPITSLTVGYQWFTTQRWFPSFSLGLRYSYLWSTAVQGAYFIDGVAFCQLLSVCLYPSGANPDAARHRWPLLMAALQTVPYRGARRGDEYLFWLPRT